MRRLLALLALLFAGAAVGLQAPAELDVEPGRFVSIPVRGEFDGELIVHPPAGFALVGVPALQGGRALVNLLVAPDVRAGAHQVQVQLRPTPPGGSRPRCGSRRGTVSICVPLARARWWPAMRSSTAWS
jgi:hypothetical protein